MLKRLSLAMVATLFCCYGAVSFALGSHTEHFVYVQPDSGTWSGHLSFTSAKKEGGYFCLDKACSTKYNDLYLTNVDASHPFHFYFGFNVLKSDFDIKYNLTVEQVKAERAAQVKSMTCEFSISAKKAADPDVRPITFNGADCSYKIIDGSGEDYCVGNDASKEGQCFKR